ncbi:hypothetical protein QTP88_024558 [Uroleucon formosanum]
MNSVEIPKKIKDNKTKKRQEYKEKRILLYRSGEIKSIFIFIFCWKRVQVSVHFYYMSLSWCDLMIKTSCSVAEISSVKNIKHRGMLL